MENENKKPVRPSMNSNGTKPVRPNTGGVKPVRPNMQSAEQKPVIKKEAIVKEDNKRVSKRNKDVTTVKDIDDINLDDMNSEIVNDTVLENKNRGKIKEEKVKKELTPEQKKKIKIVLGSVAGVLVVGCLIVTVVRAISNSSSKDIKIAGQNGEVQQVIETETSTGLNENTETMSEAEQTDGTNEVEEKKAVQLGQTTAQLESQAVKITEKDILKLGQYTYIDTVVNTKTAEDKQFTDHEAKLFMKLNKVEYGYEEVSKVIEEFNNTNKDNKKINLPAKDDYYIQSSGTELAMYEFIVEYPSDYPTSESEGIIYTLPTSEMSIQGTVEEIDNDDIDQAEYEKYIVVDKNIYGVGKITPLISLPEKVKTGEQLTYRFITSIPGGANKDNYKMQYNLTLAGTDFKFNCEGQEIKLTEDIVALKERVEAKQAEEGTTETESETAEDKEKQQETEARK